MTEAAAVKIILSTKATDSEDSGDIQELVVVFSALKVDTVVSQEDMSAWLACDSDLPTCQAISDEAIVQDISQAANKVHMPSDACSSHSPDSDNVQETKFDSAPTDQEAADVFTICIRYLGYSIMGTQTPILFVQYDG